MSVIRKISCVALIAMAFVAVRMALAADDDDTMKLEGKAAPNVKLDTLDGKSIDLSKMKGDVVLMDYWATWCPPCRASLPHLNEIAKNEDYKSKGLKVFAINSREEKDKVQKFMDENKLSFTVPMDPEGSFGKDYLVRGIPTTVVVGRDGNIKKVFIGFGPGSEKEIAKAVEAALKDPKPIN